MNLKKLGYSQFGAGSKESGGLLTLIMADKGAEYYLEKLLTYETLFS